METIARQRRSASALDNEWKVGRTIKRSRSEVTDGSLAACGHLAACRCGTAVVMLGAALMSLCLCVDAVSMSQCLNV